jgi:RNA methyltransferase, TrmH family
VLTSTKNPKVAAAARLKKRSFREDEARFLVEGAQAVSEALEEAGRLEVLFVTDELAPVVATARQAGVDVFIVTEDVMAKLTSTVTPQGLVGVAPFLDVDLDALPEDGCLPILHEVRDPGNAGTVLRSADAAGAGGVVFSSTSVDVYNPKTVRASAGSLFHLPVVRGVETQAAIEQLRGRGYRILAMAADGVDDLYRVDLSGPVAFVFGNEARGLPPETLASADRVVHVPIAGKAESLNLAAAASICLFEWTRQRASKEGALGPIISSAAHDIRSPLTAMKGFGYALERRWNDITDEQRSIMLRGIVHDADRMDTVLRQLVDAARLTEGGLEIFPEQTDLAELVRSVSEQQGGEPEQPRVEWLGGVDQAFVDPARLKTTLLAFIESLVWWGQEGTIHVEAERVGDRLHLWASRRGTELTSAEADARFVPRSPGSGAGSKIGMFVARGVAEAQGGRAWGDVTEDRLRFHVELPLGR